MYFKFQKINRKVRKGITLSSPRKISIKILNSKSLTAKFAREYTKFAKENLIKIFNSKKFNRKVRKVITLRVAKENFNKKILIQKV